MDFINLYVEISPPCHFFVSLKEQTMKIKVITLNGETKEIECDSFEFRSNQVANWIRIKTADTTEMIHGIAVIKSLS